MVDNVKASPAPHAPVRDGECAACHNPHSAPNAKLLVAEPGVLCVTCHAEIGKAVKGEHSHSPAASGDCNTCHVSHASPARGLLTQPVATLCISCHDGDSDDFKRNHLGVTATAMNCAECHDAHGSSTSGLLMNSQHAPFESRECNLCHVAAPAAGGKR